MRKWARESNDCFDPDGNSLGAGSRRRSWARGAPYSKRQLNCRKKSFGYDLHRCHKLGKFSGPGGSMARANSSFRPCHTLPFIARNETLPRSRGSTTPLRIGHKLGRIAMSQPGDRGSRSKRGDGNKRVTCGVQGGNAGLRHRRLGVLCRHRQQ